MTREVVEGWARTGESETQEFKKTTGERRAGTQTLCGMLNHRGGRVLYGVLPDGTARGQDVGERTIEDLAAEIAAIDPPVFPTVDRISVGDTREVLVVTVSQGPSRPYSYKGQAYRRVGSTTREMSREEYNRMLLERLHGEVRWENRPAEGWTVSDLDVAEITRTVEEAIRRGRADDPGTRDPQEILRGFGLIAQGALLRAALVLFGRRERLMAEFPQCLLRVARFAGTDKTEFRDNRQVRGHAFELLVAAERFLREHVPIAGRVVPDRLQRVDEPLYPPVAVREALANAFCHRDYSIGGGSVGVALYDDRLEITSSGTLHFGLTPELLFGPHESLPWNPLVAGVFYRRGIIETWGRGTLKMAEQAVAAGLPRPEIEDAGGCVTVRFRPRGVPLAGRAVRELTSRQRAILAVLHEAEASLALREIHARMKGEASERQVREDLARLKALGLADSTGRGRGARWNPR